MKKLVSLLLAVMLLAVCAPTALVAEPARAAATFTVDTVNALPGGNVVVSVRISGTYQASAITFSLDYDASKLTYQTYSYGSVISSVTGMPTVNPNNAGTFAFSALAVYDPFTAEGTLVDITFRVAGDCSESVPLTLTVNDFYYMPLSGAIEYGDYSVVSGAVVIVPAVFTVSDAVGAPGGTVTVNVSVSSNYFVHAIEAALVYDPSKLAYVSYTKGDIITNGPSDAVITPNNETAGEFKLSCLCITNAVEADGLFFSATFDVSDGCTVDQVIQLRVDSFFQYPLGGTVVNYPTTAENGTVHLVNTSPVSVVMDSASADPGDDVFVTLTLNGEYMAHGMRLVINYDPDQLTYVSFTPGAVLMNRPSDAMVIADVNTPGTLKFGMICPNDPNSATGAVVTLKFHVSESCTTDQPLIVTCPELYFYPIGGMILDIPYNVESGVITINGFDGLLGDVNCDGEVTMADVSALIAYLMNSGSLTDEGIANADANQDGTVDILDATAIYAIAFGN